MPFPFIVCAGTNTDDHIARINIDATWSVRWDRVLDEAYADPHPCRVAVQSTCKLLLAARDNFFVTPWPDSDKLESKWEHFQSEMVYLANGPAPTSLQAIISYHDVPLARVNHDGSWSIEWELTTDVARMSPGAYQNVALIGICRLFVAARDRFWTTPWYLDDEDDEWN